MPELATLPGLFGQIHVVDSFPVRKVFACGKLQGSLLHEPLADQLYPDSARGPGPVTDTAYQLAWLMAGARHPRGRGLMIGLGAGSGAVALLHHFPELQLDAVEIDPNMISVARDYFPLVAQFEHDGRLQILNEDGVGFLARTHPGYDFALVDISIDGGGVQQLLLTLCFSESLMRSAGEVWINILSSRESPFLARLLSNFDRVTTLFSPEPLSAWLPLQRNWIATSAKPDLGQIASLKLYPGLDTDGAERSRRLYAGLIENRLLASDIPAVVH